MTDLEQRVHDALLARWDEWGYEGQDVDIALIAVIAVEVIESEAEAKWRALSPDERRRRAQRHIDGDECG